MPKSNGIKDANNGCNDAETGYIVHEEHNVQIGVR